MARPLTVSTSQVRKSINAKAAAIPCELEEFGDMIHAYLNLENLVPDACREIYQRIGGSLNA